MAQRNDGLNNKANEVNNLLVNMCGKRHIPATVKSKIIHRDTYVNKSRLYLNKFWTIAFAKNISKYFFELNLLSPDNRSYGILESQQASCKASKKFVSESVYNLIDVELRGAEKSNISYNLRETSGSSGQPMLNAQNILKNSLKNLNRLIFAHININSIQNKVFCTKQKPHIIQYRSYKKFSNEVSINDLRSTFF